MAHSTKHQIKDTAQPAEVPVLSARDKYFSALFTFAAALTGYLFTFARTVTLVDSGELILACASLGVAHPPGFPLYTVLGHLFSRLPAGSVAARLSFMSSLCAALAAALVTMIVAELLSAADEERKPASKKRPKGKAETSVPSRRPRFYYLVIPAAIGLSFAYAVTVWFYAAVAEVYTLNIALLAAIIYLMLCWRRHWLEGRAEAARRYLLAAALLYGLALGVHHVTILLALPAIALLVGQTAGRRYLFSRVTVIAFIAALIGVTVYVYLPIAAARAPEINWTNPSTWQRFCWHVSGKQYQVNLFAADADKLIEQLGYFFRLILRQFTPLGLALALTGLWALWQRQRTICYMVALIILFDVLYALNYEIAEDKDAYYLTTILAAAMAMGAGAKYLLEGAHTTAMRQALVALVIALPMLNFALHYFESNKRHYLIARDYVENTMRGVGEGALLLTVDWQFYSPYLYLRHVESYRRDAIVVDVNLVRRSWYVEEYLPRVYPEMMRACANEQAAFMEQLRLFEADQPYDTVRINETFIGLINAFVNYAMARGSGAYTMLPMEPGVGTQYSWVPQGLAMRFYADKNFHAEPVPPLELRGLLDGSVHLDEVAAGKVKKAYAVMIANRGRYLGLGGRIDEAREQLKLALQLDPTNTAVQRYLQELQMPGQ